jgi:hypothetical protein
MFTQYFIVFCFVCFFTLGNAFADSIEEIEKTLEKYTIDYQERSYF